MVKKPFELRTKRLLLRSWREEDIEAYAKMNSNPRVMEFFPLPYSREESDRSADRIRSMFEEHGYGLWAVEIPNVSPFIGIVGVFHTNFKMPFTPCVEIGWRLNEPYWGKGYATEAAQASMQFGFETLGLPEIVAFTVPSNIRSRRVMEKLGMIEIPENAFDHPNVAEGHPLRRHVFYRRKNPLQSRPLSPENRDDIIPFIVKHTHHMIKSEQATQVLDKVIASSEHVCDLTRDGNRIAVAVLIDTCDSEGNAAELSLATATADRSALNYLLGWAERKLAGTSRSHLDIPQYHPHSFPEDWITSHGFYHGYTMHQMERPLPYATEKTGVTWQSINEDNVRAYYETLRAAFATLPGAFVPDFETFRYRSLNAAIKAELIIIGGMVQGFVRLERTDDGAIEIVTLGRHPEVKGRGFGRTLLNRGLEQASKLGASTCRLEVATLNHRALSLYETFGFKLKKSMNIYRRAISI